MKPVIIAICGKAASGKDTLLKALAPRLGANIIVSDTTRPPREGEINGVDYNFISEEEFDKKLLDTDGASQGYLEFSCFRGWFYGTSNEAVQGKINIGVFNFDGLMSLLDYKNKYNIFPIYLKTSTFTRIKRYIQRDKKFKFECVRRLLADWKQFYLADIYIEALYPQHLVLKNFKIEQNLDDLAQHIVSDSLADYYQ